MRTMARARATRWRWPPESWPGLRSSSAVEPELVGGLLDHRPPLLLGHLAGPEGELDVRPHGLVGVEGVALEHHGDVPVLGLDVVHRLTGDLDDALGGVLEAGQHPQRGRFSRRGVCRDRPHQQCARHGAGNERLQGRPLECPGNGVHQQQRENHLDRTLGHDCEHEQRDGDAQLDRIAAGQNGPAAVVVDHLPRRQRQAQRRNELHQPDQTQSKRAAGKIVDQPSDGGRLHLVRGIGSRARDEEKPE